MPVSSLRRRKGPFKGPSLVWFGLLLYHYCSFTPDPCTFCASLVVGLARRLSSYSVSILSRPFTFCRLLEIFFPTSSNHLYVSSPLTLIIVHM